MNFKIILAAVFSLGILCAAPPHKQVKTSNPSVIEAYKNYLNRILNKRPFLLYPEEFEEMNVHVSKAEDLIQRIEQALVFHDQALSKDDLQSIEKARKFSNYAHYNLQKLQKTIEKLQFFMDNTSACEKDPYCLNERKTVPLGETRRPSVQASKRGRIMPMHKKAHPEQYESNQTAQSGDAFNDELIFNR